MNILSLMEHVKASAPRLAPNEGCQSKVGHTWFFRSKVGFALLITCAGVDLSGIEFRGTGLNRIVDLLMKKSDWQWHFEKVKPTLRMLCSRLAFVLAYDNYCISVIGLYLIVIHAILCLSRTLDLHEPLTHVYLSSVRKLCLLSTDLIVLASL